DLVLLCLGPMVYQGLEAAQRLQERGVSCTVINARFVKPLDEETITKAVARCGRVITVEEHVLAGGFGSAVREMLGAKGMHRVEIVNLGLPDAFIPHGNANLLREKYGLCAGGIMKAVEEHFAYLLA
ncbi:MAG TPA: 1-deoxy-D-xylulose-5-phosphate synthase, partial [Clostridia bacterium]|nr:1-deoxy-D-xylulose-5-phosphate synthase [Clostridia bacterium]